MLCTRPLMHCDINIAQRLTVSIAIPGIASVEGMLIKNVA